MATEATSTKDQIRSLVDSGVTDASQMAEQLGVGKATVYSHLRNIRAERGEKPRKRGRPPAVGNSKAGKATSRPAPPKATGAPKAASPAKVAPEVGNGRTPNAQALMRFLKRPRVMEAIRQELAEERKESEVIEQWLDSRS